MHIKMDATCTLKDSTVLEVIDENALRYNGVDYFFDPGIVHYDSQWPDNPILSAHRDEAGVLFVRVHVLYTEATKEVWQTPDAEGNYRGHDYEDHSVGVVLALPPLQVEEAPQ